MNTVFRAGLEALDMLGLFISSKRRVFEAEARMFSKMGGHADLNPSFSPETHPYDGGSRRPDLQ